jgi:hypothetical protein
MPMHDRAAGRLATRSARETGCRVYVPGEVLQEAGIGPDEWPLRYRFWAGQRGRIILQLERERKRG